MPISLEFGPWSPDLASNPVQMPDTQGPVPIPCADCLNVIFANGSYRSIPSPAPAVIGANTAPLLSAPALAAYSYYDNVSQAQTVFAGTQTGLQQLTSGAWATVPFLTSQSASMIGQVMAMNAGNFANATRLKSASMAFTAGKLTNAVFGLSFVAGQYSYKDPLTRVTVTSTGYSIPPNGFGTCKSPNLLAGGTMIGIFDKTGAQGGNAAGITLQIAYDPTQSAFTTLTTNGKAFPSSAALYAYFPSSQTAEWVWQYPYIPFGYASGSTYSVVLK